jgi:hypothetical protein
VVDDEAKEIASAPGSGFCLSPQAGRQRRGGAAVHHACARPPHVCAHGLCVDDPGGTHTWRGGAGGGLVGARHVRGGGLTQG